MRSSLIGLVCNQCAVSRRASHQQQQTSPAQPTWRPAPSNTLTKGHDEELEVVRSRVVHVELPGKVSGLVHVRLQASRFPTSSPPAPQHVTRQGHWSRRRLDSLAVLAEQACGDYHSVADDAMFLTLARKVEQDGGRCSHRNEEKEESQDTKQQKG